MALETLWLILALAVVAAVALAFGRFVRNRTWSGLMGLVTLSMVVAMIVVLVRAVIGGA